MVSPLCTPRILYDPLIFLVLTPPPDDFNWVAANRFSTDVFLNAWLITHDIPVNNHCGQHWPELHDIFLDARNCLLRTVHRLPKLFQRDPVVPITTTFHTLIRAFVLVNYISFVFISTVSLRHTQVICNSFRHDVVECMFNVSSLAAISHETKHQHLRREDWAC